MSNRTSEYEARSAYYGIAPKRSELVPAVPARMREGRKIVVPAVQMGLNVDYNQFTTVQFISGLLANAWNGSVVTTDVRIERQRTKAWQRVMLRFEIIMTNAAATVTAAPYFIDNMKYIAQGGSGDEISKHYNDSIYLANSFYSDEQRTIIGPMMGLNPETWKPDRTSNVMQQNEVRSFYLPIINGFSNIIPFNPQYMVEDIILRLDLAKSIILSGSGTPVLRALDLIVESDCPSVITSQNEAQMYRTLSMEGITPFYDDQRFSNVSLEAGIQKKIQLNNLSQKTISHFWFAIRPAPGADNPASQWSNVNLGADATLDIQDGTRGIISDGSVLRLSQLTNSYANQFNCSFFRNFEVPGASNGWYLLSYSDNPMGFEINGNADGLVRQPSVDWNLAIQPTSTVAVAAVQTITQGVAAASGKYCFTYKGEMTVPLAYDASVAAMKSALESLPAMERDGLSVTFSATAAAGTSYTATFTPRRPVASIGVIAQGLKSGADADIFPSVATTTAGVSGWTNGYYDIRILAVTVRNARITNGRLSYDAVM